MYNVLHPRAKCLHISLDEASTRITLWAEFLHGHITTLEKEESAVVKESNTENSYEGRQAFYFSK